MKRTLYLLALLCAALCLAAAAAAKPDGTDARALERYLGVWIGGEITVEIRRDEGGEACRIVRVDANGERDVWVYAAGWYDAEADAFVCAGCERFHERTDGLLDETVREDWSFDDMESARFTLSDDGEALVGADIAGLDDPLELCRQDDAGESVSD